LPAEDPDPYLDAAGRLAAASGGGDGRGAAQQVAVLALPPAAAIGRLLVAWSLVAGAALVVEPHPQALVATAAWARPTLFAGDRRELARLAAEAARFERTSVGGLARRLAVVCGRRAEPPPPFGRLRVLLECAAAGGGSGAAEMDVDAFFADRGVVRFAAAELLP